MMLGKETICREISKRDLARPGEFRDFINSLVREKAQILEKKKITEKEAEDYLKEKIKEVKGKKTIFFLCFDNKKIIAKAETYLLKGTQDHIAVLRMAVRDGYRGRGLGNYLMEKTLRGAKSGLKPRPKIIKLSVFETNKPAIELYEKHGFKKVARLPGQYQFKGCLVDELIMILRV